MPPEILSAGAAFATSTPTCAVAMPPLPSVTVTTKASLPARVGEYVTDLPAYVTDPFAGLVAATIDTGSLSTSTAVRAP